MKKMRKLLVISIFAAMPIMLGSCSTFLSTLLDTTVSDAVSGQTSQDMKNMKVAKTKKVLENY